MYDMIEVTIYLQACIPTIYYLCASFEAIICTRIGVCVCVCVCVYVCVRVLHLSTIGVHKDLTCIQLLMQSKQQVNFQWTLM